MGAAVGPQVPRADFPKLFDDLVSAQQNRWRHRKASALAVLRFRTNSRAASSVCADHFSRPVA